MGGLQWGLIEDCHTLSQRERVDAEPFAKDVIEKRLPFSTNQTGLSFVGRLLRATGSCRARKAFLYRNGEGCCLWDAPRGRTETL